MPQDRTTICLKQMRDHATEAVSLLQDKTREDLDTNRTLSLSIVRLPEIIGEAANRIDENVRREYNKLPWREIISLRNRLIHGYDSVDHDIVWQIVRKDLPDLIAVLSDILKTR